MYNGGSRNGEWKSFSKYNDAATRALRDTTAAATAHALSVVVGENGGSGVNEVNGTGTGIGRGGKDGVGDGKGVFWGGDGVVNAAKNAASVVIDGSAIGMSGNTRDDDVAKTLTSSTVLTETTHLPLLPASVTSSSSMSSLPSSLSSSSSVTYAQLRDSIMQEGGAFGYTHTDTYDGYTNKNGGNGDGYGDRGGDGGVLNGVVGVSGGVGGVGGRRQLTPAMSLAMVAPPQPPASSLQVSCISFLFRCCLFYQCAKRQHRRTVCLAAATTSIIVTGE
jgi:hypothetical protein